ncbi:MAG: FHA domain-containing protein [Chloroflexi bacterium]|nr:FHA domain-containing protein [Chloroflexota bacterium]
MDRMTITIEILPNQIGPKRANVRSSLVVGNLLTSIKDKYNLDGNFVLLTKGDRKPLHVDAPLDQEGVADGSVLVCARVVEASGTLDAIKRGERVTLSKGFKQVYVLEERQLAQYDIRWQPAIIGRKDRRNPSNNKLLAVDLEDAEDPPTVSRHHACITEKDGAFFIESIADNNPTYLGDQRLKMGMKYPLPVGSRIRAGRVTLTFYIIS